MRKILVFLFCISVFLIVICNKNENKIIIPKNAIRYRIINSFADQEQKFFVNSLIEPVLENIMNNSKNINESRGNIVKSIPLIENILDKEKINYNISYGLNYFPKKTYKNIVYSDGDYESLVIKLGSGLGDNWWCVMFPPLCLIEAKKENIDEIEYSFYLKDILTKYF